MDAWSLFEHAQCIGSAASLHCFEVLLMECEWGETYEHEIALSKGLEGAAGNVGDRRSCGADEANGVKLLNYLWEICVNHEACNPTFASIWSARKRHSLTGIGNLIAQQFAITAQVAEQARR